MGNWKKRSEKDWRQRLFPGAPPMPVDVVRRYNAKLTAERKSDPFLVLAGGLRHGDHLFIDWMHDGALQLNGCRVAVYRGKSLLKWAPGGWLRDDGGRCLYAPYLNSLPAVSDFVQMLATTCGYTPTPLEETQTSRRFSLDTVVGESRRIVLGDKLVFGTDKTLRVIRLQGTINMSLYRSGPDSCIMVSPVNYVSMTHHPTVIARLLAEANALWVTPSELDTFTVVSPR